MTEGFYAVDTGWRLLYVNSSAEQFWQRSRDTLVGSSMLDIFPAFAGSKAYEVHRRALEEGSVVRAEVISTARGVPVELNIYPDRTGISVYFNDLSQRLALEQRILERDDLLTLAERSAGIGIWDSDLIKQTFRGTPHFFGLHGLEPVDEPVSFEVTRALRHPEDRERVVSGFNDAIARGDDSFETEYRIVRPDGRTRWIFGRGRVIRDAEGRPVRYSGVDIDITERKRQEDQLRLITHELRHRANNLLAVIQAMARQTLRASTDLSDFESRFDGRVRALADSNELLVHQDWHGVPLDGLVQAQLHPFGETDSRRFSIAGPSLELVPRAVQTLGLALHELATNASKYGALSIAEGRVAVSWELRPDETGPQFRIEWRESEGPRVKEPERSGFGRFVTETMVAQSLNAKVTVDFAPSGLVWTATCHAADIILD
jgi:two-component sensor histidine kinase/PAS domain-containing protein